MARTTDRIYLIWDKQENRYLGRSGIHTTRTIEPKVYFSRKTAESYTPAHTLPDGTARFEIVEHALWGTITI